MKTLESVATSYCNYFYRILSLEIKDQILVLFRQRLAHSGRHPAAGAADRDAQAEDPAEEATEEEQNTRVRQIGLSGTEGFTVDTWQSLKVLWVYGIRSDLLRLIYCRCNVDLSRL